MLARMSPQKWPQSCELRTSRWMPEALPTRLSCQARATNAWLFQERFLNRGEFGVTSAGAGQLAREIIGCCVGVTTPNTELSTWNRVGGGSAASELTWSETAESSLHVVQEKNRTVRAGRPLPAGASVAWFALAPSVRVKIGACPETNSELIARRSTTGSSAWQLANSLPRTTVRSSSMRGVRSVVSAAGPRAALETVNAVVGAVRVPTSVSEHFCTMRSPDVTSTSRNVPWLRNSSANAIRSTP